MKYAYRDLLKHSSVYALGQILARVGSIIMMPVYTHYLRPGEFATIAILDLFMGFLAILIGSGMAQAVNRFHFEAADQRQVDRVWWSGLTFVVLLASCIVGPVLLARDQLASFALGEEQHDGARLLGLAAACLWFGTIGELPTTYLNVRKWSGLFLLVSMSRLLVNIALNVWFLVGANLGVAGVLIGNLITSCLTTLVLTIILWRSRGPYLVDGAVLLKLLRYGAPIIGAAFLSLIMHNADRYLLRLSAVSMENIGIYSLAYTIGQGVNSLLLIPFSLIWNVLIFEIAAHADARQVYANIFRQFVNVLSLLLLGVSLLAWPLVRLLAAADYAPAADLIPVVCLAYFFFSLNAHFTVPALLAKRTETLLLGSIVAAAFNILANLVFVPYWGSVAAAWVTVITFVVYSFIGLWSYRKIDRYDYSLGRSGATVAAMILTFGLWKSVADWRERPLLALALAALLWLGWCAVLLGPQWRRAKELIVQIGHADPEGQSDVPLQGVRPSQEKAQPIMS